MNTAQKFHKGDHVRIEEGDRCGEIEGIVVGSYADQFGGDSEHSRSTYTLDLAQSGEVSWFDQEQLTLIESGRLDLMGQWKATRDHLAAERGNLDWIFTHGEDVLNHKYSASIHTLAACLEITVDMLWGRNGEGIVYYERSMTVLHMAAKFLQHGDRAGWIAHCDSRIKEAKEVADGSEAHSL